MSSIKDNSLFQRFKNSPLFKDSFWAVSGNGIGNALMLFAGIFIARTLGKELYGEYGMVKTTMFYLALFSTFALGDTSTKYVAEYIQKDSSCVYSIIKASLRISFCTSVFLALSLVLFSGSLAAFINNPQLSPAFKFLGIIIIFRSLNTIGAGILGGLKEYKRLGINNILAGVVMMVLCIPLTLYWSLYGALSSLLISQVLLSVLNLLCVYHVTRNYSTHTPTRGGFEKELMIFSYPFAINELVYTVSSWGCNLLIAKYASIGDLGMLSACSQWNSIILFMPGLLGNVILSHLSTTAVVNDSSHTMIIKRMLLVNFICTLIPFLIVLVFSNYIADYYGPTFKGMEFVLEIYVFGTIFTCLTRVFQFNLMSEGKKWPAMIIRCTYNLLYLLLSYVVLKITNGENAAMNLAWVSLFISMLCLSFYLLQYFYDLKYAKIAHSV